MSPVTSVKILLLLLLGLPGIAFGSPSDSLDVLHYEIHMDTMEVGNQKIRAHTFVTLSPKFNNLRQFRLDLLKLTIDSVWVNGTAAGWNYNDTLLEVLSPVAYNTGDTVRVGVWYQGTPQRDPSTFGGFYLNNNYQYNLGVGLESIPHNFGRTWFPCKDNFTDRALFDFYIRVPAGKVAVCNGTMMNDVQNPDGTHTFHWRLHDDIPTYLAGMAVSDYIALRDTYINANNDSIPVALYFRQPDSARMAGLFSNLNLALTTFENHFGPYIWERIGYVGVPFLGGAMEHATSVAFPLNAQLATQDIMAHELAHSWFGNLVTCDKAEEMWLNEGWASYCEALYFEARDDSVSYKNYNRTNHANVLRRAHVSDNGYFPVGNVPQDHTYGWTVYVKGASVAHNLRKYLGDSLFFAGIRQYVAGHRFTHANSDTLRIALEAATGRDLRPWFDGWVHQPGFPHFGVDSFVVTPMGGGNFNVRVHVRQRLRAATQFLDSVRLDLTFLGADFEMETRTIHFSGPTGSETFMLNFEPVEVMQDLWEKILGAGTDQFRIVSSTGPVTLPTTYLSYNVLSLQDSAFIRTVHNFIAPDTADAAPAGVTLSGSRYWDVEGYFPPGCHISGSFNYNGSWASNGLLDQDWFTGPEDSLVLLYRRGPGEAWTEPANYSQVVGSPNDLKGTFELDSVRLGQYTLGFKSLMTGISEVAMEDPVDFSILPNPTDGRVTVSPPPGTRELILLSVDGSILGRKPYQGGEEQQLDLTWLPAGVYLIRANTPDGSSFTRRISIYH